MSFEATGTIDPYADDVAAVARIDAVSRILDVVCRTTGMGFAAVARVSEDRWIACAVRDEIAFGLSPGEELDVKTTICDEVRSGETLVVIDHVAEDTTYCAHPTPKLYGFQSYISVPIRLQNGDFFGTLCAIDPKPAKLNTPETVGMFQLFADLIAFHLTAHDRVIAGERALELERRNAELRDQFIAVLGHDLRNPLAAIRAAAGLMAAMAPDPALRRAIAVIQNSASRMSGLIENVLDFARGRLGGGLTVMLEPVGDLQVTLEQVVNELRTVHPDRTIDAVWAIDRPVVCDRARLSQLLSNLVGNALTHGDPTREVSVSGRTDEHAFVLEVGNAGTPIPPGKIGQLFQPFERASEQPGRQGLGLGLYIAAEIARSHRGTIDVESTEERTRFSFRMPTR